MPFFSDEALQVLADGLMSARERSNKLVEHYAYRQYRNNLAKEHAQYGFGRRILTIAGCMRRVFAEIPPDQEYLPTDESVDSATVNIQAFIFNAFGAIDNLAHVWVHESGLKAPDKKALTPTQIGFGKKNTLVRTSLSAAMQAHLSSFDTWFEHLADFRHALGHRIPLYIVPYCVPDDNNAAYAEIDACKWTCTGDSAEYQRLKTEQLKLVVFRPIMKHSFADQKPPVVFHFQLLQDFATIEDIALKLIEELDRLPVKPI